MALKQISFYKNWNNKLNADVFPTFRAWDTLQVGEEVEIIYKKEYLFTGKVLDKKKMKLESVNEWIARLDTGLSKEEFLELIHIMYKNKSIDFKNHIFTLYLIERIS